MREFWVTQDPGGPPPGLHSTASLSPQLALALLRPDPRYESLLQGAEMCKPPEAIRDVMGTGLGAFSDR